jgi:glycosyltransferase involved in cell wall biosynthesis
VRILALNWRCTRHREAGGAEVNLFEQARHWVADGHDVTVVCADPGREAAPDRDEPQDGITVRRRGGRATVYLQTALFLLRRGRAYDCVLDVSNGVPFFSPLFTRVPVVLLVHHVHRGQWRAELPAPLAVLGRFLEERIVPALYGRRPVIAVSPTTRDALLELGFEPDRVTVVYNGVDVPSGAPEATAPRRPTVVYVGRLKRYKRIERLVVAFGQLRRRYPEARLEIAGEGDARGAIEATIDEHDLREHVTLHGRVDEAHKAELLRSATVFATPSMHEGWGVSVIEANSFGCPAVAYDVPGLSVAVRHGETGLLAQDDEQFRESIALLLEDGEMRARMSRAASAWAVGFSWSGSAERTLEVLRSAMTHGNAGVVPVGVA